MLDPVGDSVKFIRNISILSASMAVVPGVALGKAAAVSGESTTVLDPEPFTTTRANALGGALSTVADDLDALYYNPAGIGGLGLSNRSAKAPFVPGLYFPYVAESMNANAQSTQKQFNAKGAQNDAGAGAAIMDDNAGKRQYARVSFIPMGLMLGRTAIVPVIDHQIAAVPVVNSPGDVKIRYRTFSGFMIGSSVADNANRFSLGFSQAFGTIQETAGTFKYVDMVDVEKRKAIFAQNRDSYAAKSTNVGMTIRVPKSIAPTFSVVARNVGNTKNPSSDSSAEPLVYKEDLTTGFSISPQIGKNGRLNMMIEGGYLTQQSIPAKKKIRAGVELLLGGETDKSILGLRVGGNDAGASYGAHLNVGLIGLEAESHAVDIGIDNERLIERRSSAVISINVASF